MRKELIEEEYLADKSYCACCYMREENEDNEFLECPKECPIIRKYGEEIV